ncbi:immune inhibitor A domain-containing protein [Bacillus sp. BHET2]|uniref:immune inhibitor A domain-containing protein n=1 Tax=Bacillus sp. BHET2 TaxID=2583818 RepID=UPI001F0ED686|nr:immune inhibitor A domain-containing protein [Bacillus sp. BHET2]
MKSRKVLSMAMVAALSVGAFTVPAAAATAVPENVLAKPTVKNANPHAEGPFDLAIANEEKLIEMLQKSGKLSKNATAGQAEKAVQKFLKEKSEGLKELEDDGEFKEEKEKIEKDIKKHKKGDKHKGKKRNLDPVEEENYTGDVRTDKVLVLLMEFPDFPHNSITPEDSDMYYADYVKEHYQDMVFGENGYTGPNGENFISMKQYYEQQTNGAYSVDGEVAGWYQASKPAAAYGGNDPDRGDSDTDARGLIKEALQAAANDPNVDMADYDQEDRYDLDGDGVTREPDGLVDHLMVVHSAVGEEAGGGSLGEDAIWSHRWNLGDIFPVEGTETDVPYWDGQMAAYDYTVQPADGAAGVFSHEYGHDLGLPDEYDTQYSGTGEAVAYWSIMASGSWAGKVPGTEPTGFSAWSKEYLQAAHDGNWLKYDEVDLDEINKKGMEVFLDQANTKGTNLDALKINLPEKETKVNTPFSGEFEYFSGSDNDLDNSAVLDVDLTNADNAELTFKAWYDIEQDWDYGSVQVSEDGENWTSIPGNLTTDTNPNDQNPGHGITGKSNGWVDASFDLSQYAGKDVQVKVNYLTDGAAVNPGLYVDDIKVVADGNEVFADDAEGEVKVSLEGFTKDNGVKTSKHYYLLEWRNHQGVDEGLAHIRRGNSLMTYDPGLIIWYADEKYGDNWTGVHPGEGFLGVVDADQRELKWSDKSMAATRYQIHDAAFSMNKTEKMFLDYRELTGLTLVDKDTHKNQQFYDKRSYLNEKMPDAGRNVPEYGLKIKVTGQSKDRSVGRVEISKK